MRFRKRFWPFAISLLLTQPLYSQVIDSQTQEVKLNECSVPFTPKFTSKYQTREESWKVSQKGIDYILRSFIGVDANLKSMLIAVLSHEHIWFNGDPGGAKTLLTHAVFTAELRALSNYDKKEFVLQFTKMTSEAKLVGYRNMKKMLKNGEYEIVIDDSLVDEFIFAVLDEVEKGNPAVLTALLSILEERQAFNGFRVVESILKTAALTSNKTMAEFIQSFDNDRYAAEALADRVIVKHHVTSRIPYPELEAQTRKAALEETSSDRKKLGVLNERAELDLKSLRGLIDEIEISPEVMEAMAILIRDIDGEFVTKADETLTAIRNGDVEVKEYFPANQFSKRSILKLINTTKASYIVHNLMAGVKFDKLRKELTLQDLIHVGTGSLYQGPGSFKTQEYETKELRLNDRMGNKKEPYVFFWNPVESEVRFKAKAKDETVFDSYMRVDLESEQFVSSKDKRRFEDAEIKLIIQEVKRVHEELRLDDIPVKYEFDEVLENYAAQSRTSYGVRAELEQIKEDRKYFTDALNDIIADFEPTIDYSKYENREDNLTRIQSEIAKIHEANKDKLRDESIPLDEKLPAMWELTQLTAKELKEIYFGVDHSIEAHLLSILNGSHLIAFGPPGSAKTSLGRKVFARALKTINEKDLTEFREVFTQQFHKLLSEGVIKGFPDMEKMLDGKDGIDYKNSLVNKRFPFALLDEVEKGNPAVMMCLLSILNERKVFHGSETLTSGLVTAILTVNKLPQEIIEYMNDDRSGARALFDRILAKVYLPNKFGDLESMVDFMVTASNANKVEDSGYLYMEEISTLAEKVVFQEEIVDALDLTFETFQAQRLPETESSFFKYMEDNSSFPHYVIKAAEDSTRTDIALMKQVRYSFIIKQLLNGTKFEDIRFEFQLEDMHLLANGLLHWGPYKVYSSVSNNGLLTFESDISELESLLGARQVNERNKFVLSYIKDEVETFVKILNNSTQELQNSIRKISQDKGERKQGNSTFSSFLPGKEKNKGASRPDAN